MADPYPRDPDHKLLFGDRNIPINVYMRDHWQDFIEYLKANRDKIEPIVYTSGVPEYANMMLDLVDPKREVFVNRLYQGACHVFEKKDEDIFMMIKDITRFKNRDPKRTILLDPLPINFILSPENGLPAIPYNAEMETPGVKDNYLEFICPLIDQFCELDDVRVELKEQYKIR